jgi:hypothetical protein
MSFMKRFVRLPALVALAAALASLLCGLSGCPGDTVTGKVLDIAGEALPGVYVQVEGARHQTLTNSLGEYAVAYRPGPVVLRFHKSGYTPGRLEIAQARGGATGAGPVRLWRLPPDSGVFLYENHRYRPTRPIECEEFLTQESGLVFGTTKYGDDAMVGVTTPERAPMILCHNTPGDRVRLSRIEPREVVLQELEQGGSVTVWLPAQAIPASLFPIDEPDNVLMQVQLFNELDPGSYALHWGALDGDPELDPRMFVFTVGDPVAPVAEEESASEGADPAPEVDLSLITD